MQASTYSFRQRVVNRMLRSFGRQRKPRPFTDFIAFKETHAAAKAAGLSVADYLERRHLTAGRTPLDKTMDGLAALGVFNDPINTVCEIGPGSGRYLEKTKEICRPGVYEIYETSPEWRDWLIGQYGVAARNCDGRTLTGTESGSVDLIVAHRVFPGNTFLSTVSYLREMARVVSDGGWVVFDIMTEECFRSEHLKSWFEADPWKWEWSPRMTGKDYAVEIFAQRGVSFVGSFIVPHFPAVTECMVFRRIVSK